MSSNALPEQALAFYRTPARFLDFRDPGRPLGGDVGPLLRLAGGATPEALELPPDRASADEWQAAARFFVEQILLAPGASYYRMHGLTAQARDDEIKANHRLLMRFLHPDREHSNKTWHTAAAARINQAYATLRDSGKRAQYDAQLEFEAQNARAAPSVPLITPAPVRRSMRARYRSGDTPMQRYVWRHLPQVSLAALVVLASVSIGWIWLYNKPSAALGGGDEGGMIVAMNSEAPQALAPAALSLAAQEREALRIALQTPLPERTPAPSLSTRQEAAAETPLAKLVGPAVPAAAGLAQSVEPVLPLANGTPRSAAPVAADANALRSVVRPPASAVLKSSRPAPDAALVATRREQSAPPVDPVVALELRAETTLEKRPAADPGSVIPQLAQRYERGNLEQFMALFHDGAHNETGGRSKIRKDYEDLFASTTSRQLFVWDMRWTPAGGTVKGDGRFQVRIQRQNENFQRLYNGTLNIEVSAEGNPPLILGIYHHVSNQSNN